ncbi:MAG: polysaccharide deacetylase family protein [Opitutus sp.]
MSAAEEPTVRRVAFVFDDGPVPAQTQQMLAVLKQAQIHVTFSYEGRFVAEHPDLARAATAAGHDIANHSYTHPHLKTLSDEAVRKELTDTNEVLRSVTGRTPVWFWAPFLETDARIDAITQSAGLVHFPFKKFHFVSTEDWNVSATDAATIRKNATTGITDRTVVLCHEWRPETLAELPGIITTLKAQGAVFLTFSEMAKLQD